MMEFVAKSDLKKNTDWYCENEVYFQMYNNEVMATIKGESLPSPNQIRASRRRAMEKGKLPLNARIEPTPLSVKLWEHYNA